MSENTTPRDELAEKHAETLVGKPGKPAEKRNEAVGKAEIDIELGPLKIKKLPRPSGRTLLTLLALTPVLAVAAAAVAYLLYLQPRLEDARDLMRRGQYAEAVKTVAALPGWLLELPPVERIQDLAGFGSDLYKGVDLPVLEPRLLVLQKRYPQEPDVLVFEGLVAYYVNSDVEGALKNFTQAAERDPAHAEAHFLAAGRHIDLAYIALGQGDEPRARREAGSADRLIDDSIRASPFARDYLPYASVRADLYELQGETANAQALHSELATLDGEPQSALQALFLSWRLPRTDAMTHSLESVSHAVKRLRETDASQGWSLHVDATTLVYVKSREDKLCLLSWAAQVSTDLLEVEEGADTAGRPLPRVDCAAPGGPAASAAASAEEAGQEAAQKDVREVLCVEVLTAQGAVPPTNARWQRLEQWAQEGLACSPDLHGLPALPPGKSAPASHPGGFSTDTGTHSLAPISRPSPIPVGSRAESLAG